MLQAYLSKDLQDYPASVDLGQQASFDQQQVWT